MKISIGELSSLVDRLRDFLRFFEKASNCLQILLPKNEIEIGSIKSEDNLFAPYHKDIIERPNKQFRLSFRIGNNNSCYFSIKKFDIHVNQFILTEIVNLNYLEIHHPYSNRFYVANKCEITENNYDV